MRELEIKHTKVFTKNWEALNGDKRFIVNSGGSRSSKTHSLMQLVVIYCLMNENKIVSVMRKTFPSLRGSVMREFFQLMREMNIYKESSHNRTEHVYTFDNGSMVEFFSVDNEQKLRGRKRDIAWVNEANDINYDSFYQINIRTNEKVIFDFNPSEDSYLDDILKREDSILIHSTYLDNPFLEPSLVKEIENLIDSDENFYRIFVLGEKPSKKSLVFTHFKQYIDLPEYDDFCYGLDLGYNDPTVLMKTYFVENKIYTEELLYESKLTTQDLIKKLNELGIEKNKMIYSDHRPEVIEEIKRAGFLISSADKNIKSGIDYLKSRQVFIKYDSLNLLKEIKYYSWRVDKEGNLQEGDPVDAYNHACFVGDTLISMKDGYKRIEDVEIGDYVKTSTGYKKVLEKWNNGKRPVKKYRMEFDTFNIYVTCTPDHKIKSNETWTPISELKSGTTVYLDKNLMENITIYTQGRNISQEEQKECMSLFGNSIMVKDQKDITFTTLMKTLGIIELKILNVLKCLNTYQNTLNRESKVIQNGLMDSKKLELKQLQSGIEVRKEGNGILKCQSELGLTDHIENSIVMSVEKNMKHENLAILNFVTKIVNNVLVQEESERNEIVWDLTIEDDHEYYANGILVHNCDSLRYSTYSHRRKIDQTPATSYFKLY